MSLLPEEIERFVADGFVKIEGAFPRALADAGRDFLWKQTGCDPADRATWTKPVVRLAGYGGSPFAEAANTPKLHAAFDALAGKGRWARRDGLGSWVVRFPMQGDPGDTGWHIDASFAPPDDPHTLDYGSWRINARSRDRLLLMLFLFSDVSEGDAPTRIAVGSHLKMAKVLEPLGEGGESLMGLGARGVFDRIATECPEALATGEAGTVWLCHPFLVHAAQVNHGPNVRFLTQPPLTPVEQVQLERADGAYSPVERAIRLGLDR